MPESLGNKEVVLDNGVVCDRCNKRVLSDLDQTLAEFFPIKAMRTLRGIRTKSGKLPVTKFSKGVLSNEGSNVVFKLHSESDTSSFRTRDLGGGLVKIDFNVSGGRRLTERYASSLSRALLKATFECAWLDHGLAMLDPEFDHVRAAVLGAPRDGYVAMIKKGDPGENGASLTYWLAAREDGAGRLLVVVASLFGVVLATDSLSAQPANEMPYADVVTFRKADAWVGPGGEPNA